MACNQQEDSPFDVKLPTPNPTRVPLGERRISTWAHVRVETAWHEVVQRLKRLGTTINVAAQGVAVNEAGQQRERRGAKILAEMRTAWRKLATNATERLRRRTPQPPPAELGDIPEGNEMPEIPEPRQPLALRQDGDSGVDSNAGTRNTVDDADTSTRATPDSGNDPNLSNDLCAPMINFDSMLASSPMVASICFLQALQLTVALNE